MTPLVTASRIERLMACPGSLLAPGEELKAGAPARKGTAAHEFIHAVIGRDEDRLLAIERSTHPAFVASIDIDAIRDLIGFAHAEWELAMEWRVADGACKAVFLESHRAYPGNEGCLYGTADLLLPATSDSDAAELWDIKTGKHRGNPADDWQLRTLAVMVEALYKPSYLTVGFIYIAPDGTVTADAATMTTANVVRDYAHDLRALWHQAHGDAAPRHGGSHCRYCHARPECEAAK